MIAWASAVKLADRGWPAVSLADTIGTAIAFLFQRTETLMNFDTTFGMSRPDHWRTKTAAPNAVPQTDLGVINMFTLPDIHPLMNFESIRCELKRCCRQSEHVVVERLEPMLDPLAGPEGQLFRDDTREIRVSLKWLRQRIQTFGADRGSGRDDWSELIAQVTHELELLQRRATNLQESIQAQSVHSSDTGDADSRKKEAEVNEDEGCSGADGEAKADVTDEELCCC